MADSIFSSIKARLSRALQLARGRKTVESHVEKFESNAYMADAPASVRNVERDILVYSHIIEKGLCHGAFRTRFGERFVEFLVRDLAFYERVVGAGSFASKVARSSLKQYAVKNSECGENVSDIVPSWCLAEGTDGNVGGCDLLTFEDIFSDRYRGFAAFARSRRSTRLFDCKSDPIGIEEVIEAVAIAQSAPSACNRQAVKVYAVWDEDLISDIASTQGGASGFAENAGALLVVTIDYGFYTAVEVKLPMYDAGIYTMNLLYAIHDLGIGACPLNPSLEERCEAKILDCIGAGETESLAGLVLLSRPSAGTVVAFARSPRRATADVLKFVGNDN